MVIQKKAANDEKRRKDAISKLAEYIENGTFILRGLGDNGETLSLAKRLSEGSDDFDKISPMDSLITSVATLDGKCRALYLRHHTVGQFRRTRYCVLQEE
jgi:hypothetical protein